MDIIRIEFSLRSVITDTTDRYGPIITVGGVGGDFSHTAVGLNKESCAGVDNDHRWRGEVLLITVCGI